MRPSNFLKVFYVLAALAVIGGLFLPYVNMHQNGITHGITLFSEGGIFAKVILGVAAVSAIVMIIKYTRVLTFLTTAITCGCVIIVWAQWKDKIISEPSVVSTVPEYTSAYGATIFLGGAIMLLVCGILCFMFVEED